jgi:hypothetical protein
MTGDRATLLALELIRRQLGGLPGELARAMADVDAAERDAPAPSASKPSNTAPAHARIDGFDTTLANSANRLAVQGWPKVIQLVNLLLQHVTQRALAGGAGPRAIAGPRAGIPLDASGTAAARAAAASAAAKPKDDRAYLDKAADAMRTAAHKAADALVKLRTAVGNRTSKAFGAATSYVGRNARRLAGKASNAWQNSRPGRAYLREWNSHTARGMRAGAARGAKAIGRGAAAGAKAVGRGAAAGAKGVGSVLTAAISPFAVKLMAVLGPMALLAATLSQATSGFQLVISSTKLLASSLAPILLPFAFMLAVALASLSDVIWAELAPNLQNWYRIVVGELIPRTQELITNFKDLVTVPYGWVGRKPLG